MDASRPLPPAARAGSILVLVTAIAWTCAATAEPAEPPAPVASAASAALPSLPDTLAASITADPDSALQDALAVIAGEPLSLARARAAALAHATALQIAAAEVQASRGSVRSERGVFLPELYGEAARNVDDTPTASFFAGAEVLRTEQNSLEAGARWRLPIGTELTASLNASRLRTNSAFATLSPQYDAFGRLELVQPLLKGFGAGTSSDLTAARRSLEADQASYEDARLAAVAQVERIYWDLFAAERDLAVQLLVRDQARAFLREAQLRADAGLAGPGDVASARLFLVQQGLAAMDSEERLDALSDQLTVLTGIRPRGEPNRFHPLDRPPETFPPAAPDTLVELALAASPQVASARRELAAAEARAAGARRNALPQLDLRGTLGGYGLAGTGREVILDFGGAAPETLASSLDTGLGTGLRQVIDRDYPAWSAGLVFTFPFGGRDRGERDRLQAEVLRNRQQLGAVRRELAAAVRVQLRELQRGRERLQLASQGVQASLEQVRIGRLQFRSGQTTAFELVRLGADLADAQSRYSAALVRTAEEPPPCGA